MSDTIIRVENLSKSYTIRHQNGERYTALRDVLANGAKNLGSRLLRPASSHQPPATSEEFWALNDVSFEVKQGERVGIIGRNGAGKSTLLKILSRITEPTKGRVHIKGRVASLLEVGTGFHPELTGRENISLNGAILGMSQNEIRRKFDEIVAFAEVEKFLDTPVKRYSSGMYVRLAFAVAAHLEPEILIIDEVLAVGDAEFQKKCLGKMNDVASEGRTVLFVSHNMSAIQTLCERCLLLREGKVVLDKLPIFAVQEYLKNSAMSNHFAYPRIEYDQPKIVSGQLADFSHAKQDYKKLDIEILSSNELKVSVDIRLLDATGIPVGFGSLGVFMASDLVLIERGSNWVSVAIATEMLAVGTYFVSLDLTIPNVKYLDRIETCLSFDVTRRAKDIHSRVMTQSWGYGSVVVPLMRVNSDSVIPIQPLIQNTF